MIGHPFPGCLPVARFVRGHLYELHLTHGIVGEFVRLSNRFYRFIVVTSDNVKDTLHKRHLFVAHIVSMSHHQVREINPDSLPLYINWHHHTDLYRDLLSSQKILTGKKCPVRLTT